MARRKTPAVTLQSKHVLAERIMTLRMDLYGPRGGPELARRLGIPVRTWYNYEGGITVPGEILLKIIEVTSVDPMWLLHGTGPRFTDSRCDASRTQPSSTMKTEAIVAAAGKRELPTTSQVAIAALLRAALRLLGNDEAETSEYDESPLRPEAIDARTAALELGARFLERITPQYSGVSGNGTAG